MDQKRLTKSANDRIISGVCGGVAEYLDMDPSIIRLIWVIVTLFAGSGVLLYIIALIILPEPAGAGTPTQTTTTDDEDDDNIIDM